MMRAKAEIPKAESRTTQDEQNNTRKAHTWAWPTRWLSGNGTKGLRAGVALGVF